MDAPSRLGHARRRVRIARYAIATIAAAGFAGVAAAARVAHPGHATSSSSASSSSSSELEAQQQSSGFGSSSIAPAQSAPSVQSGGS